MVIHRFSDLPTNRDIISPMAKCGQRVAEYLTSFFYIFGLRAEFMDVQHVLGKQTWWNLSLSSPLTSGLAFVTDTIYQFPGAGLTDYSCQFLACQLYIHLSFCCSALNKGSVNCKFYRCYNKGEFVNTYIIYSPTKITKERIPKQLRVKQL